MSGTVHTMLIDHDNAQLNAERLREALNIWIERCPDLNSPSAHVFIKVRAYGGWFRGVNVSADRFEASEFYEEAAPSLLRRGRFNYFLSFEFADTLASESAGARGFARITHTVTKRGAPSRVSQVSPSPSCSEPDCGLRLTRKWLRGAKACPRAGCPLPFSASFERWEQKQVDVHLAVDLLTLLNRPSGQVALWTDDSDLLPAALEAARVSTMARRMTLLRSNAQPYYADSLLVNQGTRIIIVPNRSGSPL